MCSSISITTIFEIIKLIRIKSLLYTVDVATHLKDFCDMASAINSRDGQAAQEQQYGKQFHDCVRRRNKRMELTGFAKNLGGASFYVEYEQVFNSSTWFSNKLIRNFGDKS